MKTAQRATLAALAAVALWGGRLAAADLYGKEPVKTDDVALPKPAEVASLASHPAKITLKGLDDAQQLIITADGCDVNLPIHFANQVVPIFTKLGCNSGGCHGKASGQNGFKLSLLGFEPDIDYTSLVKEARGRRVFPASPDNSLLLLKATGTMAHGGGKRMEVGSDEYRLIRRWIGAGTPFGAPTDPVVTHITVYPPQRTMTRQNK